MNQRLTILLIFSLLLLLLADAQPTQAAPDSAVSAGFPVAPLCLPEHQASQTADCQSLGPTAYLEQLESQGISMPRRPLPAVTIDPAFSELPYNYVRLGEDETPIFSTLDEAMARVDFQKLVGRPRAVAVLPCPGDVRVIELPLQPLPGGRFFAARFEFCFQAAMTSPRVACAAPIHRRRLRPVAASYGPGDAVRCPIDRGLCPYPAGAI